jgi:alpha-tubulin suppressor-like RCC1 family protein
MTTRRTSLILLGLLVAGCSGGTSETDTPPPEGTSGASGQAAAGAGGSSGNSGNGGAASGSAGAGAQAGTAGGPGGGGAAGAAGQAGAAGAGATGGAGQAGQGGAAGQAGGGQGGGGQAGGGGSAGLGGNAGASGAAGSGGGGLCTPGAYSCLGDLLQLCENGAFTKLEACGTGLCDEAAGKCQTCKPGEVKGCAAGSMSKREICALDGSGFEQVDCAVEAPYCAAGSCVACLEASHCPAPPSFCQEAACVDNACAVAPVAEGKPLPEAEQTPHDCKLEVCDGQGGTKFANDDLDVQEEYDQSLCTADGCKQNVCTIEGCSNGNPTVSYEQAGVACTNFANPLEPTAGVCIDQGACADCVPGTKTCSTSNGKELLGVCNAAGQIESTPCALPTFACSADACVGVAHLAAGARHTCALLSNGHVRCWGDNSAGQLGFEGLGSWQKSKEVTGLTDATSIAAGDAHTCAVRKTGKVVCWGSNSQGQLGGGDSAPFASSAPIEVLGLDQATSLALGKEMTCAIGGAGADVYCWGSNAMFQLGFIGTQKATQATKADIPATGFKQIAAGNEHACAVTNAAATYCWGKNDLYQVGKDSGGVKVSPQLLSTVPGALTLTAGGDHACAFTMGGFVYCWGANGKGELVKAKTSVSELPGGTTFPFTAQAQVHAGAEFTCTLSMGNVACGGSNTLGQLGAGPASQGTDPSTSPLAVVKDLGGGPAALTNVVEVAAGGAHACVLVGDGSVLCWGDNAKGQLGFDQGALPNLYAAIPVSWP